MTITKPVVYQQGRQSEPIKLMIQIQIQSCAVFGMKVVCLLLIILNLGINIVKVV